MRHNGEFWSEPFIRPIQLDNGNDGFENTRIKYFYRHDNRTEEINKEKYEQLFRAKQSVEEQKCPKQ